MSDKIIYQVKYKKSGLPIDKDRLPRMRHLNSGSRCVSASIINAGIVSKDGKEVEFQDIRVYIDEV